MKKVILVIVMSFIGGSSFAKGKANAQLCKLPSTYEKVDYIDRDYKVCGTSSRAKNHAIGKLMFRYANLRARLYTRKGYGGGRSFRMGWNDLRKNAKKYGESTCRLVHFIDCRR